MLLAIGYLITTAVRNTSEYYLTVNEVSAREAQLAVRCCAWPDG
jgi:hypothetical protein